MNSLPAIPLFPSGRLVATPGALALLEFTPNDATTCVEVANLVSQCDEEFRLSPIIHLIAKHIGLQMFQIAGH